MEQRSLTMDSAVEFSLELEMQLPIKKSKPDQVLKNFNALANLSKFSTKFGPFQ